MLLLRSYKPRKFTLGILMKIQSIIREQSKPSSFPKGHEFLQSIREPSIGWSYNNGSTRIWHYWSQERIQAWFRIFPCYPQKTWRVTLIIYMPTRYLVNYVKLPHMLRLTNILYKTKTIWIQYDSTAKLF